jgi:hypothetical protein
VIYTGVVDVGRYVLVEGEFCPDAYVEASYEVVVIEDLRCHGHTTGEDRYRQSRVAASSHDVPGRRDIQRSNPPHKQVCVREIEAVLQLVQLVLDAGYLCL